MKDGKSTSVWRDIWLYDEPLCDLFPGLFKLCEQQEITVHQMICNIIPITFSRWLTSELRWEWGKILRDTSELHLCDEQDIVSWKLEARGKFSVKSTYNALNSFDGGSSYKKI